MKPTKESGTDRRKGGIPKLLDETLSSTLDDVKTIVDARMELIKIELSEKLAILTAVLVIAVILVAGAAYLVTTIAFFVGELTGHVSLGFLSVSLVFIGAFVFLTRFRPNLLKDLIQKFIISLYD
ncbi:phage holin family protein [Chlorobium sp. N1]|uniref:phage holin family protein n=1 Tax=Chlorobium sp. N1 TaxID=2491138 RepID=UPI0010401FEC|nr:phage holin family protein [Chlorobium sp. N1]TCD48837.1 phage holin family protein [Chlorobium sp. N1]